MEGQAGDGDSASVRAFEAAMGSQRTARKWSRLTMLAAAIAGLAASFRYSVSAAAEAKEWEANSLGLQALAVGLFVSALVVVISGRFARDLVMANGWPTPAAQQQLRWVSGAALAGGLAACALSLWYFDIAATLANAALDEYDRKYNAVSVGGLEVALAALVGAGVFLLSTRTADIERAGSGLAADLARQRKALAVGGAALATLLIAAFGALGLDWGGVVPFAAATAASLIVYGTLRALLLGEQKEALGSTEEVKDEIAAMRRGARKQYLALGASLVAGAATTWLGILVSDLLLTDAGLHHLILILVIGSLVGLFTHRRLRGAESVDPSVEAMAAQAKGSIFDETLAETGSLEVRQQVTLGMLLFGASSRAQYELVDGGGAWCGNAKDGSGWLGRLFLGGRRSMEILVDDLGRTAMSVRRPFVWLSNRAIVATDREIGRIVGKWSLRRSYAVLDAQGKERYRLLSGWLFRSRFQVLENGRPVGELRRVRPPWYVRMFTPRWRREADKFRLSLPENASVDDRRLLLGALFLVDITHYPSGRTLRFGSLAVALLVILLAGRGSNEATDRSPSDHATYDTNYDTAPSWDEPVETTDENVTEPNER
jgi:hypothetical protein